MAKSKESTNKKRVESASESAAPQPATRSENIRWMTGFILLSVGIFVLCSIVSYFFYWREDMSALVEAANPIANPIYNNVCGKYGAVVSRALVGRGFGIFALAIPLYTLILGWRMFRSKELRVGFITTLFLLVLILGSLSLGYVFGTKWEPFGSGLGGEYGLALTNSLESVLGGIGTLLVIVAGWLLTGLFINRNFLRVVDNAGGQVAEGVSGAASWLWTKLQREPKADAEELIVENEEATTEDVAAVEPVAQTPASAPVAEPVFSTVSRDEAQGMAPAEQEKPVAPSVPLSPAAAMAAMANQQSPFTTVSRDVEVDANGNIIDDEPASVAPQVVDDYPFKDPSAPLEDFVEIPQCEAKPVVVDMSQMTAESGVFSTMSRADVETPTQTGPTDEEAEGMVITVEKPKAQVVDAEDVDMEVYDPMRDLHSYTPPMPTLLVDHKSNAVTSDEEIFQNKERIRETLLNFGIPIRSMHATVGPTVTLYEIVQEQGVKISKIQGLENDIAQSLKALGIRIIAPIPGRGTIGIEVPNLTKQTVSMYSAICSKEFQESKAQLPVVIGRTIQNENYTFDLAKMPHLLVAGATGQGKSVGLNAIITSLLYRKHPAELKFVLVDPKMVEFSLYNKLEKHFLAKMESED